MSAEVLSNGCAFKKETFSGLKEWSLARDVLGLIVLGFHFVVSDDHFLDLDVCEFSCDHGDVSEKVASVVVVEFLNEIRRISFLPFVPI